MGQLTCNLTQLTWQNETIHELAMTWGTARAPKFFRTSQMVTERLHDDGKKIPMSSFAFFFVLGQPAGYLMIFFMFCYINLLIIRHELVFCYCNSAETLVIRWKRISTIAAGDVDPYDPELLCHVHLLLGILDMTFKYVLEMKYPMLFLVMFSFGTFTKLWFPSGHQTWLAGKSPMEGSFHRKITNKWSIFQHAMFDETRG